MNSYLPFTLLVLLYSIQGVLLGLFSISLQILLTEAGMEISSLRNLTLASLPYSFKFVFAPIVDSFYSKRIGKRMTYIIPTLLWIIFQLAYVANESEGKLKENNVTWFTLMGFILILMVAIQDVAVDGLATKLFNGENSRWASSSQTMGVTLGFFLSFNILLMCLGTKVISFSGFLWAITIFVSILTFLVIRFVQEPDEEKDGDEENISFVEILKAFPKFLTNKYLGGFIAFIFLYRAGFAPIDTTFRLRLIQKGMDKKLYSQLNTIFFPLSIITPIILAKKMKSGSEMKVFVGGCFMNAFSCLFAYWLVLTYDKGEVMRLAFLVFMQSIVMHSLYMIFGTFVMKNAPKGVEGTFITLTYCFHNFGRKVGDYIAYFIADLVSFEISGIFGLIYFSIVWLIFRKNLSIIQNVDKNELNVFRKISQNKME